MQLDCCEVTIEGNARVRYSCRCGSFALISTQHRTTPLTRHTQHCRSLLARNLQPSPCAFLTFIVLTSEELIGATAWTTVWRTYRTKTPTPPTSTAHLRTKTRIRLFSIKDSVRQADMDPFGISRGRSRMPSLYIKNYSTVYDLRESDGVRTPTTHVPSRSYFGIQTKELYVADPN